MVSLEKNENIVWERGANLRTSYKKTPGTLFVTTKKIYFLPFISNKPISIFLKNILEVEYLKGFFKKIKIITKKREYVFSIKNADDVANLIKTLLKSATQDL